MGKDESDSAWWWNSGNWLEGCEGGWAAVDVGDAEGGDAGR